MVKLQCPHCDEDIELDDGDSGMFNCPYCSEEFYWKSRRPGKLVTVFLTISIIFAIGSGISYLAYLDEPEECENCTWEESVGRAIAEDVGTELALLTSMYCGSISGIFFILTAIIYAAKQAKT